MKRSGSALRRTAAVSASAALTLVAAMLGPLFVPTPATAQARCAQPAAIVRTIDNDVRVALASTAGPPVTATRDMAVCAGDTIQVAARSRASVYIIASNTLLRLDQNSQLELAPATAKMPYVSLVRGALLFITRLRRSFEVRTPFVNASVEGTEFVVRVGVDRATVTVLEGRVRATRGTESVDLNAGEQALAVNGQPLTKSVVVRPRDAVQWALYYEPLVPADTFAQLDAVPAANQDAAFFVRRAGLLLGVGQLDAARADLDQAEKLNPGNGDVNALRAITAVALNDKTQALENGRRAVERSPNSVSARLALSYALQANFQLEEARAVVSQATSSTPNDASAWARLAELRLMLDDVAGAASAAQRAVMLAPQAARPRVVLGFTQLAQLKVSDAERTFERALATASDDPLAHLGRGLAKIRQGHLAEGRSDLELAVALSPDDAIIRSYLGKAYFDEKRELQADQQFVSAKALDPLDPTAWYYDAIQKQSLNRPVEALADIEQAIQLNDNRAVYRSRLLLEDDSAGRGARLGRVYRDLGFEQLALVEGWKSVAIDPANHSAHRLLADNYLVLPRHQIARDSELLQSQLLQPLNINPVQPRLAGNGLNFLDDTGAFGAGYNEFTRLFAGNQIRFVGDGIVGQQGTRADNVIVSGVYDRLSFSAGQFHYQTDGIRQNNDARQDIYNFFLQSEITRSTSAQIEVSGSDLDLGDRRGLFDRTNFLPAARTAGDTSTVRIGGRHRFGPGAVAIGSYFHHDTDSLFDTGFGFTVATKQTVDSLELRYLHSWRRVNVTVGGGHFSGELNDTAAFGPQQFPATTTDIRHTNVYAYADTQVAPTVIASAGVSRDDLEYGLQRSTVNPKFGVTWSVDTATTVRAAATRSMKRTLVLTQTIEPTQVAGFNQFFDDNTGADAWRYGVGVDRRLGAHVFAGAEVSRRNIDSPTTSIVTGEITFTPEVEWFANAYVYATSRDWWAVSGEYQFTRLDLDPQGNNAWLLAESTTHKLGMEARAFAPWGGFGRVRGWFVHQDGRFQNPLQEVTPGKDRFFTVDASFGYRLPRRLGIAALDIRNAFDKAFSFQDSSPEEPTLVPARQVSLRVTVTF